MHPASPNESSPRIAIIGSGIIGLCCAFELAVVRGVTVTVYDPHPMGRGASWAAAGMLAPAFEAAGETDAHPRLFDLCLEGAMHWPQFVSRLEASAITDLGFQAGPSIALATDAREAKALDRLANAILGKGIRCESLDANQAKRMEPALSDQIQAGLYMPTDGQVDNRSVVSALIKSLELCPNATLVRGEAPLHSQGNQLGVDQHDLILAAAGWNTAAIQVEENGTRHPLVNWDSCLDEIDCYGGQLISVAPSRSTPKKTLRNGSIYIAPKADRVVIGATVEPGVATRHATDEKIAELRMRAARLCPGLEHAEQLEAWAGIRPGTPDLAPILGKTRADNLYVAAGHYRNGILLAPITAQIIADIMLEGLHTDLAGAFTPARFSRAQV